ncbi:MAG: PAS domain S-box protein [Deltaproteobacteria bacterium]|nr:PAS domain S-box protein [Deltaproteobacteria bacterium]
MSESQTEAVDWAELAAGAVFDAAPDAMVLVDEAGTIVLVNAQTERVFGWPRAELVGRPVEVLLPQRFRAGHGAHRDGYANNPHPRPMGAGDLLFGLHRDGREIPVEIALSPIATPRGRLVAAAVRDITERRLVERRAMIAHQRLLSALESVQDALAIFDAADELVLCNSVYRRGLESWTGPVTGASFEALLDAEIPTLDLGSETVADHRARRIAYHRAPSGAIEVTSRDGRSLRIVDRITPEGGRVTVVYDLSDDVRRQQELEVAKQQAEDANAAKTEFLRSMSHELRTPLNAVLGFTQLIQRDASVGERPRRLVEHVRKGGEHLLRLIDDVLDLARVEAGAVPLSVEPVAVDEVLEEARTTLASVAEGRRVTVSIEPAAERWVVLADRTRLAQIVLNFGSNAIKYGKDGGRAILRSTLSGRALRVSVLDDGPGIAAERQDRLFQAFYRAGQETGPVEGTGIGLALSRRLADMMGGSVGFESRAGHGAEFWVELPLVTAEQAAPLPHARPPQASKALAEASILYVEDNPANVAFMEEVMADLPHVKLLTAPTGELGLELAIATRPHLIILDINLPGISGFEVLRGLRDHDRTRAIPVIALSASAMQRDIRRAEAAGFARYLTKPVKIDELLETLESLLEHTPS